MMGSGRVVGVLGRGVVDAAAPQVLADDLGLTRGDGCFDALRVVKDASGLRFDHADAHLARFARSAERLGMPPIDPAAWRGLIAETAAAWPGWGEAFCKVIWTRGPEYADGPPTGVAIVGAAPRSGVPLRVATLTTGRPSDAFADAPWLLGGVKTLSYAVNVAAKREAARRGADDVLFVSSDGYLLEGPTSALVVSRNGVLFSTPTEGTGILASVTVGVLAAQAARHGREFRERLMEPEELHVAKGAWLVSAVRGVCPIVEVDGVGIELHTQATDTLSRWAGFGPLA